MSTTALPQTEAPEGIYEIINPATGRTVTTFKVDEYQLVTAFIRDTDFQVWYAYPGILFQVV